MKLTKKTPAFTLTEMLIVLAISAIVVGLAFSIISLFGKNMQLIQKNYSNNSSLNLLENQLNLDFNRFHTIEYKSVDQALILKTPIDSISYSFKEGAILRNLDTVFKANYSKKAYLLGNEIDKGLLDALKIEINADSASRFLFVYNENDANFYLTKHGD